jgi:hypothetical protein
VLLAVLTALQARLRPGARPALIALGAGLLACGATLAVSQAAKWGAFAATGLAVEAFIAAASLVPREPASG